MQVAKVLISENRATVQDLKVITSGTVGATVAFEFDATWNGFSKTYVFRTGFKTRDDANATGIIPADLLTKSGQQLEVGVYGTKGDIVLPTIWADLGVIRSGADPSGDQSTLPHLPVWAQLQQGLNETEQSVQALQMGQIVCSASGEVVTVNDASGNPLEGLTLCGKTTQDGIPTPGTPIDLVSVGDGGSVGVTVCGKNLIPYPYYQQSVTSNGGTFTVNADSGITVEGTPTDASVIILVNNEPIWGDSNIRYIGLTGTFTNARIYCDLYDSSGAVIAQIQTDTVKAVDLSLYPTATSYRIGVKRTENNVAMSGICYPMLCVGDDVRYEPYVSGGTLNFSTPTACPASLFPAVVTILTQTVSSGSVMRSTLLGACMCRGFIIRCLMVVKHFLKIVLLWEVTILVIKTI